MLFFSKLFYNPCTYGQIFIFLVVVSRLSLTVGIFGLQNSKNPIHQMIYEYMEKRREHVLVKTYQEAVQRVMDSNYAFIGESISQDLAAARHCNLIRAPEVIGARGFGIATTQGESLCPSSVPLLPGMAGGCRSRARANTAVEGDQTENAAGLLFCGELALALTGSHFEL